MLARTSFPFLVALALAGPVRAEPSPEPSTSGAATRPTGGVLALAKLRRLLLDRLSGQALEAPKSPRYLALPDPAARGTRVLVGWVLPGLAPSDLPDLRALTDALSAALRGPAPAPRVPFDAFVSLDTDGEAPLVVVELSASRSGAARALEQQLLRAISSLGALPSASPPADGGPADAGPLVPGRLAAVARAQLGPLARAVVEVHPVREELAVRDESAPRPALIERSRRESRRQTKGPKRVLSR